MTHGNELELKDIKKIYCSGIGGIGLSSVAQWFLAHGVKVYGSDAVLSDLTKSLEKLGAIIYDSQKAEHISTEFDLFLYTPALPEDHPELLAAKELGIPCLHLFEIEGWLSRQHKTLAVAGTNGKSTTTAMLGLALEEVSQDPTVIVGTKIVEWDANFRLGRSPWLAVEACEYQEHFLEISSDIAIINNIELDHLDYFRDEEHLLSAFQKFINNIKPGGWLVANTDDRRWQKHKFNIPDQVKLFRFGSSDNADLKLINIEIVDKIQSIRFQAKGKEYHLRLQVPGKMNAYNALAAVGAAIVAGIPIESFIRALEKFKGTWRRFEILLQQDNKTIISDYAHHPTAIKETIAAAKQFYPNHLIKVAFQPHQHYRVKALFDDFAQSFDEADEVYILPIYKVTGRTTPEEEQITSESLSEAVATHLPSKKVSYLPGSKELVPQIVSGNGEPMVWLIMSAGDLDWQTREHLEAIKKEAGKNRELNSSSISSTT